MQTVERNSPFPETTRTPLNRLDWRPVSLLALLAKADTVSLVAVCGWFAIIALCIWWGLYGEVLNWNPSQFSFGGLPGIFDFYLPWAVGVLLVLWFGFEWAAVPVYLSTLFNDLSTGDSLQTAVVDALHNPLGIAVIYLIYSGFSEDYALRSLRAWLVFIGGAIVGGLTISVGAIIWKLQDWQSGSALLHTWISWWLNFVILLLVIVAPLVYLFSPGIERMKQRHFLQATHWDRMVQARWLLAVSLFMLTTVFFVLINDHWQRARIEQVYAAVGSTSLHAQIAAELNDQRIVVWVLAGLLAVISLGGLAISYQWVRRVRARAAVQTQVAQEALQSSEARFQHFFEHNPAPMWAYDPQTGKFLEVNLAATLQYGYSRDEFLSMSLFDIRPQEDVPRLRQQMSAIHPEPFRQAGEWRHRRKDGSLLDVEIHVSSMRLGGRPVHLALAHDISPRKQAQEAMERRARELRILAASSLEIVGAQTVEQVLQISADRARQLIGTHVAVVRCHRRDGEDGTARRVSLAPSYAAHAEFQTAVDDMSMSKLLTDKCPLRLTRDEMHQHPLFRELETHSPVRFPLQGLLVVPLTASGKATGILVVSDKLQGEFDAQDEALLTQLAQSASVGIENVRLDEALRNHMHELERRVAERTAELDSSNRELDAFAYSVAHDLRAPLRAMHGFANAVLEDYGPVVDAAGRNYLTRIVAASQNMDILIQELLAYSRIGRAHMVLEAVSVDEVVRDALAQLASEVEKCQAKVSVNVPKLVVQAHRGVLKQVIQNLVSNAIKFVAPGTLPEVGIDARAHAGWVILSVADNGIGIAPEHRERIFNVFERLHGAETYPGNGVGLSIVKKGLARMHGEISVEAGHPGSVFKATLKEFQRE